MARREPTADPPPPNGEPNSSRILATFGRPDTVDRHMVEQLREHFPVTVRTVYRTRQRSSATFRPYTKRRLLVAEALFFLRYLISPHLYRPGWRFVIRNGHYASLLFARILRLSGQRRSIYLLNFYLHDLGRNPQVKGILRFLLTSDVRVLAQTRSEEQYFQRFLPRDNITYIPYSQGESRHVGPTESTLGDYVFAGGMVNRDYDMLLRCAEAQPDIPFVIVASKVNRISRQVPPNVRFLCDRPAAEFDRLVAGSRMVIVPLKNDVGSSGQMVVLKAMSLEKAIIVPRIGAILDYVEDGRTAKLYGLGDCGALEDSLVELYHDCPTLKDMGAAARKSYLECFTPAAYRRRAVDYICGDST